MAFVIDRCYSADEVHGGWATPVWMAPVRLRASLVRFRLGGTLGAPGGFGFPVGPLRAVAIDRTLCGCQRLPHPRSRRRGARDV
jgi:hypothetical protein